jgi:hypothetical protein
VNKSHRQTHRLSGASGNIAGQTPDAAAWMSSDFSPEVYMNAWLVAALTAPTITTRLVWLAGLCASLRKSQPHQRPDLLDAYATCAGELGCRPHADTDLVCATLTTNRNQRPAAAIVPIGPEDGTPDSAPIKIT